jgi:hypothetical protein
MVTSTYGYIIRDSESLRLKHCGVAALLLHILKSRGPFETAKLITLAIMACLRVSLVAFCAATATVLATLTPVPPTAPIVTLDQGKFVGTTANGVNQFLGIPFAQPPSVVVLF